jgi:hypothetical protein
MAPTFCGSVTWSSIEHHRAGLGSKSARSASSSGAGPQRHALVHRALRQGRGPMMGVGDLEPSAAAEPSLRCWRARPAVRQQAPGAPRRGLASAASTACQPQIQSSETRPDAALEAAASGLGNFRPFRASLRS